MAEPIEFDPEKHQLLLSSVVEIHIACIESDNTIATFLPPLQRGKMLQWWQSQAQQVVEGRRIILVHLSASNTGDEEVTGVVMLSKPVTETGPFRGIVEKLLVSPKHRQRGIAKQLMQKLEEVARRDKRTLLLLDTETGSPAEMVYHKLGYTQVGTIPLYGTSPLDGTRIGGTFFYKNLLSNDKPL